MVTCAGAVHLLKMPSILNPLHEASDTRLSDSFNPAQSKASTAGKLLAVQDASTRNPSGDLNDENTILKSDIECFPLEDLTFKRVLLETVKARTKPQFTDPFRYVDEKDNLDAGDSVTKVSGQEPT